MRPIDKIKEKLKDYVDGRAQSLQEQQSSALTLPNEYPQDFCYTRESGLTGEEAAQKMAQGLGNEMKNKAGKSFKEILFSNLFTFFNILNMILALCVIMVGSWRNTLFMLIVLANVLIGTIQELRAQKTIQKLQLLNAPVVNVLRDGVEAKVSPAELVKGDLVVLRAGDQVPADAVVISGSGFAMESLLTGESNAVPKTINNWLYSGSYINEGKLTAQLVYVAEESYAGRLTTEAKKTERPRSALMTDLNRLIRFDSIILVPIGILMLLKKCLIEHIALTEAVPNAVAAMIGMIPEGLMLLTSVALAVGVIKLGMKQTLVQELYGIESLARVDVLCLDKTGTITSGEMELEAVEGVEVSGEEARQALARFMSAFDDHSGTLNAIRKRITPTGETPRAVLPFSSARKKSAATFADATTLIMGAPTFVLDGAHYPADLRERVESLSAQGKRVTVLASARGMVTETDAPAPEKILGLVILSDEIRPAAADTIRYFNEQQVTLKVISGDDPHTVSAIARQVGIINADRYVDATTLQDREAIYDACEKYAVFGRVTPQQKKILVEELKKHGHTVAMTGDGVNDIPAMKAADCSLAMAGGADAARHAAQVTLLNSDFSAMPDIVLQGRRVINNITRTASLFLTKTIFSFLLSLLVLIVPGAYPFQPIQLSLISTLTVGMPCFFLALEPSRERVKGKFLSKVLFRALPGGLAVTLCSALALATQVFGFSQAICSTLATLLAATVSYVVLFRTCVPLSKLRICVLSVVPVAFVIAVHLLGSLFGLVSLDFWQWVIFVVLAAIGCAGVLVTDMLIRRGKIKNRIKIA